jgi:hypothetical protein
MKWLSVVILVCLCIAGFAQKDFHSLDDIIVLTRNLDTVNLSFTSQPSIILLASENTCSRCYETLENELNSQKTIDKINLIAVVRLPNCNPCRREFLKNITSSNTAIQYTLTFINTKALLLTMNIKTDFGKC